MRSTSRRSLVLLVILQVLFRKANSQQCYYPNGSPVTAEPVGQCYSWGGACCPVGWTCFSNNLCVYQNQTGRYSCVDSEWGNSCPNFCRDENDSSGGDQAVQDCGNGVYCCNGRGLEQDQCCETGSSFFTPGPATAVSTIQEGASGGGAVTDSSTRTSAATVRTTKQTQVTQSVVSSSGGAPTTVQITVVSTHVITPEATAGQAGSSGETTSHSNTTLEKAVGIPVGIVGGLLIIGASWFAYRYTHKRRAGPHPSPYMNEESAKEDKGTTGTSDPLAGEFIGLSPVPGKDGVALKETGAIASRNSTAHTQHPSVSELSGTEVLQLHEEPQVAELPVEGSGKG